VPVTVTGRDAADGCTPQQPTAPATTPPPDGKITDHASNGLIGGGAASIGIGGLLLAPAVTGVAGAGTWAAAAVVLSGPVGWLAVGGAALIVAGAGMIYYGSVHSPVGLQYEKIFRPVSTKFKKIVTPSAKLAPAVAAANRLLAQSFRALALAKAFWTSEDRARGAYDAGNAVWLKRQAGAAAKYAQEAAVLYKGLPALQSQLQTALLAGGISGTYALHSPSAKADTHELNAMFKGLHLAAVARRLGVLSAAKPKLGTSLAGVSDVQFPQVLTDQRIVGAEQQTALYLELYAKVARRQEHLKVK
jgi:hypothetical protein